MAAPPIHEAQLALFTRLKDFCLGLRSNTKYSDITLKCKKGGKEFKVHKIIVCDQVKPIARALEGMWKVSSFTIVVAIPSFFPSASARRATLNAKIIFVHAQFESPKYLVDCKVRLPPAEDIAAKKMG